MGPHLNLTMLTQIWPCVRKSGWLVDGHHLWKRKWGSCRESSSLGKREWGWQGCQWQHLGSFIPSSLQWEYSPRAKASINNRHNYPVSSSQLFQLQSGKHRRRTLTGCVWLRYLHVVQIPPPPSLRQCCNVAQTGHWPSPLWNLDSGVVWVLPRWCYGKETACQCKRHMRCEFDPWVWMIPWRSVWQPTPVFMDRGAWQATVHGVAQSWTLMRWLSKHGAQHCGVSVGSEDALWFIVLPESSKN